MGEALKQLGPLLGKPLLKWAGGKTQMLKDILPRIPKNYNNYIEPFFGGGAVFFALQPNRAIIADSNPELINLYITVRDNPHQIIEKLSTYKNNENVFYKVREQRFSKLSSAEAAARTIFLNKTCFNGLYRVNKSGHFNVPYGRYKNPNFVDAKTILSCSEMLSEAEILLSDYKEVLRNHTNTGDLVFLDPPYLPISEFADFKRYTKEQFYEEDQRELAEEVKRLHDLNCFIILTNSNHPLVHEFYGGFSIEVIQTKRYISSKSSTRTGEDVIVTIPPKKKFFLRNIELSLPEQIKKYPSTRYMGSKSKLLKDIWSVSSQFKFDSVLDLFSGSGVVSYMFKSHGKTVYSNDYMHFSATFTKAMIENNSVTLNASDVEKLLLKSNKVDRFVETKFKDLYFTDEENRFIDTVRGNIKKFRNPYKKAIAMSALIRACFKKRPRGIFTYVGNRYDDGRKDLQTTFVQHFHNAVNEINAAVFDNGQLNISRHGDAMDLTFKDSGLVYMDPPYFSPLSDNEYVRRYHFVEGLARDWKGVEIQEHTTTKKFKSYPTPFSTRKGAAEAFDLLFKKYRNNILVVSYSSNSLPTLDEMVSLMAKYKSKVDVVPLDHKYSFGNQGKKVGDNRNTVKEYLFVGY